MYVLLCSMFPKVRNHGFISTYMLGRLIVQIALLLKALNNGRTFANLSELLRALLSARCKYRLHSRNSVFVIIADTIRLWQSYRFSQYVSFLGSPAYLLTKRIARKALSFSIVFHLRHISKMSALQKSIYL